MDIGSAVGIRILSLCAERNMSLNKLGSICGITQSTLNNIVHGGSKNPTVDTIRRICAGLHISLSQFFDAPCFAITDSLENTAFIDTKTFRGYNE